MTRQRRIFSKATAACVLPLLTSFGLAGCVLGNDNDPPVLSVDLYWEGERHADSTCDSADVDSMDWQLTDIDGNVIVVEEDTPKGHECSNGFEFPDVGPGDYVLKVTGYDSEQNAVWDASCDLYLDRFDRYYACSVDKNDT
ncbi:MAG: hypothetical protein ABW321_04520 [Polyangiales bacterium]